MIGSKTNLMTPKEILAAVKAIPPTQDFIWDGIDEEDRPATAQELATALQFTKNYTQSANADKTPILFYMDTPLLQIFHATGKNWQNLMNEALKEWLKNHAVAGHEVF